MKSLQDDWLTVLASIACSVFVAGVGWGRVKGELKYLNHRLTRIESMFKLKLKDDENAH
jgi:hypothetical protein